MDNKRKGDSLLHSFEARNLNIISQASNRVDPEGKDWRGQRDWERARERYEG